MIRTRILAAAAAAMVAAGTLGLSAAPAAADSASPYPVVNAAWNQGGDGNWNGNNGNGNWHGNNGNWHGQNGDWRGNNGWHRGWRAHGHRQCEPVVRTVKVRGNHGWFWKRTVVGERCYWTRW